jgi:hypothetical protein
MENNKYYTPSIDEVYVGFELEYHNFSIDELGVPELNYDRWDTTILKERNVETFMKFGIGNGVRVKCLDKFDIESLGWKCIKEYSTKQVFQSEIKEEGDFEYWFELDKYLQTKWIEISLWKSKNNLSDERHVFLGVIKNKSELKKLMQQLNIS